MEQNQTEKEKRLINYEYAMIDFPGTEPFKEKEEVFGLRKHGFSFEFGNSIISLGLCYDGSEGERWDHPSLDEVTNDDFTRVMGFVVSDLQGSRTLLREIEKLVQDGVHKETFVYHRKKVPYSQRDCSRFVILDQSVDHIFETIYDVGNTREDWMPSELKSLRRFSQDLVKVDRWSPYVYSDCLVQPALEKAVEMYKQAPLISGVKR